METKKSKDNPKARVDLAMLCDRPKQQMQPPRGGKTWKRPKADFILAKNYWREVLEWMQTLMFPDGLCYTDTPRGVTYTYLILVGYTDTDTQIHYFSGFCF